MKSVSVLLVLFAALSSPTAAAPRSAATDDYVHDAVTVATPSWRSDIAPTAACLVWENAEGLGVGPAQLEGMHGLNMFINVKPLANDTSIAISFDKGFAELKARAPRAPAWMFAALVRSRAAIEQGCAEEHDDPFVVHKITRRDIAK